MIVFYDAFEKMTDEEKVVALHDKIGDDVQTIFRQIAFFNFEKELHLTIREKGSLSKEEMANLYRKHLGSYLGPDVIIPEHSGYQFASVPHFRSFFYVYSYAFGQLASKALYAKYKENPKFIEKIKQFLSLGGSMSPEDIFKSIGVDVTKSDFFEKGIKTIEEDIVLLEKLVSGKKKK
jgi:oligoendopeptidase F